MTKRWMALFLAALLLCAAFCSSEAEDWFQVEGQAGAYRSMTLRVSGWGEGPGWLEVLEGERVRMTWEVTGGAQSIPWDGLGQDGEPLCRGVYRVRERSASGRERTCPLSMGSMGDALIMALPTQRDVYTEQANRFRVEIAASRTGYAILACLNGTGEELFRVRPEVTEYGTCRRVSMGDNRIANLSEGSYTLRCFMEKNPDRVVEIPFRVHRGAREVLPVMPTGQVIPESGMDDSQIWALMMKPSVVCDIRNVSHQKVYAGMEEGSEVLGTLHGQSQGLEVLDIRLNWARIRAYRHEDGREITGYVPLKNLKTVEPEGPYGLLIDKKTQTMKVYREGTVIAHVPVSTGLPAEKKKFRETASGAFLINEHVDFFASEGFHYDFPMRYDGGNLIHSLGWRNVEGFRSGDEQAKLLGEKASHGCVRIGCDGQGMGPFWLWTHLGAGSRVMIAEDLGWTARSPGPVEAVPEADRAEGDGEAPLIRLDLLEMPDLVGEDEIDFGDASGIPGERSGTKIRLTFGGDVVLGTRESWWKREDALPWYYTSYGPGYFLQDLFPLFSSDDLTAVNLECVLKADRNGEMTDRLYRFRGLPSYAQALKVSGVELAGIANNHHVDYGGAGRRSTREALEAQGIAWAGYGSVHILEKEGYSVGFGGMRETVYRQNPAALTEEIRSMKEAGCDAVVYFCHWGKEYSPTHLELQETMARQAAEAGADLVIGTHPHVVQGVACMDQTLVFWSLGNLMFGGTIELTTYDGLVAVVTLEMEENGVQAMDVELVPVLTSSSSEENVNDFRPTPADGEAAERILRQVQDDSEMRILDQMRFVRTGGVLKPVP